jgi:hypothetical protein
MSENAFIHKELFRTICDEKIGAGMSREVWSSKVLPNSVIKVENSSGKFQNVMEWEVWNWVRGTECEKWFAPCEWISPCGGVLIMAKTRPAQKYPDKLPVYLTDTKKANYGMHGKRFVCHDYGVNTLLTFGMVKRMRNVRWREE